MRKSAIYVACSVVSILTVGVGAWLTISAHDTKVREAAKGQFVAILKTEFTPGVAKLSDFHMQGKDAFVTASVAGSPVTGSLTIIEDGGTVRVLPAALLIPSLHDALRKKLLALTSAGMSDSDGDIYSAFLPSGIDKAKFGFLDGSGTLQENDEYVFGIGCLDRDCSGDADAWTINKNTGQMIVAMLDTGEAAEQDKMIAAASKDPNEPMPVPVGPKIKKISLYGLPPDKRLPAPLFWWVTKRSPQGINDPNIALKDDEPIDFSWKYTEDTPDQF